MKKITIVSSFVAAATLGVVASTLRGPDSGFKFLAGSTKISSTESRLRPNQSMRIDRYSLHVPFDQAWGEAENELCSNNGWHLGSGSPGWQNFVSKDRMVVSLARGKVDDGLNYVEGTDGTDTYVMVERKE